MDTELLLLLISGGTALAGSLGTAGWTLFKYRDAKKKEKEAEEKQFYLYTASNLVREAERMFGDSHGEEKKLYSMTRLQNEAVASGVVWSPKLASLSIEQAVTLRNDYKNMDVSMSDIIKQETEITNEAKVIEEELRENISEIGDVAKNVAKSVVKKTGILQEAEDSVISVVED
jgi:hypothetical protein